MAQITNKDVITALREGSYLAVQDTPSDLGKTVVPTIDGTPDFHRVATIVKSSTTTATLYTTPLTKDFFLTNAFVSCSASESEAGVVSTITITPSGGVSALCLGVSVGAINITGTAQNSSSAQSFNPPIKLSRGSAISFAMSGSNGSGGIIGYEVDTMLK